MPCLSPSGSTTDVQTFINKGQAICLLVNYYHFRGCHLLHHFSYYQGLVWLSHLTNNQPHIAKVTAWSVKPTQRTNAVPQGSLPRHRKEHQSYWFERNRAPRHAQHLPRFCRKQVSQGYSGAEIKPWVKRCFSRLWDAPFARETRFRRRLCSIPSGGQERSSAGAATLRSPAAPTYPGSPGATWRAGANAEAGQLPGHGGRPHRHRNSEQGPNQPYARLPF